MMLLYLLGVCLPPLGILLYGKILPGIFNAALWTYALMTPGLLGLVFWFCASAHATYVINNARSGRYKSSF